MLLRVRSFLACGFVSACITALPLAGQQVTAEQYAAAERDMTNPAVADLASTGSVTAHWLSHDRFWYRNSNGQFVLADAPRHKLAPAFDHAKVAVALSKATNEHYTGMTLPFETIVLTPDMRSIEFVAVDKEWRCDVRGSKCSELPKGTIPPEAANARGGRGRGFRGFGRGPTSSDGAPLNVAPDGKHSVFIRDWNLWSHDIPTGAEKQLTTDGVENFGYATDNAGWVTSDRAVVKWSDDSRMIATQQQDQRNVGMMYLVTTPTGTENGIVRSHRVAGHPILQAWPYPLPGDSIITMIERVAINVDNGQMVRFMMPPDQHRGTVVDNLNMDDISWSPDDQKVVFASSSRDHKQVWVREADASTGVVRTVFTETVPTQFESGPGGSPLWRVLWPSHEVLWYSERDGWGQFFLYDLATGKVKNKVTPGEGVVTGVVRMDDSTRTLWFTAVGREPDQNPYYVHYYRVNLDGTHLISLTPDDGTHQVQFSLDHRYLVDTWSQSDQPPASALRDATTGTLVMPLAQPADRAALLAADWHPVTTIHMKGRDGTTDIYGLMYKPANFDSTRKYPIINHIYPGPQSGSVGSWGFRSAGGEAQGLADLGFVVVEINGMGTPNRSKAFHDEYYGHMGDNTLPDQVTGMQQLARRYPWIDIAKAGIYGHSGGGFATADAMFRYPDFFKVGISESGNHDNREYEDDWGERYQGLDIPGGDPSTSYDSAANENFAANLKGHLLLAHGTMDNNVPPYNTFLVVDALIKANKDFDLLLIPNVPHGYGAASAYMQRRRWDYFVKYLMGATPPKEYKMGAQRTRRGG